MKNAKTELGIESLVYCNFRFFWVWRVTSLAALEPLSDRRAASTSGLWSAVCQWNNQLKLTVLGLPFYRYLNLDPWTSHFTLFFFQRGIFKDFSSFFMYFIQHCFICRPSDSTVSEDAGIDQPRTVATLALTARRCNLSARSNPFLPCKDENVKILRVCYIGETSFDFWEKTTVHDVLIDLENSKDVLLS